MTCRRGLLGSALILILCLTSRPSFSQSCDELRQASDEMLKAFVEKEYDKKLADHGREVIAALRAEYEDSALLEPQLAAIDAAYQDKKQAAKQAKNAFHRARDAWRDDCSEDGG